MSGSWEEGRMGQDAVVFELEGIRACLRTDEPSAPLVVVHDEPARGGQGVLGSELWEACHAAGCAPFSLLCVEPASWNSDLSPWPADAIFRRGTGFGGRAEEELSLLEETLLPRAEAALVASPAYRAIGGYSLAGLFAVWAVFQTRRFSRLACASGSLWYPGFVGYVAGHKTAAALEAAAFSLGDKEASARNPLLAQVEDATRDVEATFSARGVKTLFRLDAGGHFVDGPKRLGQDIAWMLAAGAHDA